MNRQVQMPEPASPGKAKKTRLGELGGGLLSINDLAALFNTSTKSVRRWVEAGKLPEPDVRMSARTIRWTADSIRPHLGQTS